MTMPFGQYRGRRVDELPDDYLEWLSRLKLREPLRDAVFEEHARRAADREQNRASAPDAGAVLLRIATPDLALARELIERGYKATARAYHPDIGGDANIMRRLNGLVHGLRRQIKVLA